MEVKRHNFTTVPSSAPVSYCLPPYYMPPLSPLLTPSTTHTLTLSLSLSFFFFCIRFFFLCVLSFLLCVCGNITMTDITDDIAEEISFQGFEDDCKLLGNLLNDILQREAGSTFVDKLEKIRVLSQVLIFSFLFSFHLK